MACGVILTGIENTCENSLGGIKKIYLAPYKVFDGTLESGIITELDVDGFKSYYTKKNVSSMTSTFNIDPANGTNYVSTELNLVFAKMSAEKRLEVGTISTGDLRAIVIDSNGHGWFLGKDEPVIMTAGTAQTGVAKGDGNLYNLTFTDESSELPLPLSDSLILSLP